MSRDVELYVTVDGIVMRRWWLGQSGTGRAIDDLIESGKLKLVRRIHIKNDYDTLVFDHDSLKKIMEDDEYTEKNPLNLYVDGWEERDSLLEALRDPALDKGVWHVEG